MPQLYIANTRRRNPGVPTLRAPALPNLAQTLSGANAGRIKGGLRAVPFVTPLDKVGSTIAGEDLVNLGAKLYDTGMQLADDKAKLDAEKGRQQLVASERALLYDGPDALYKKTGQDFLDSVKSVKAHLKKAQIDTAANMESGAAYYFMTQTTPVMEQTQLQVSRAELKAIQDSRAAQTDRILSDMAIDLGRAKPQDFPGIINATISSVIATSGVADKNEQVTLGRQVQDKAYGAGVTALLRSGETAGEQLANVDKAEALVKFMAQAPGIDMRKVDTLSQQVADSRFKANKLAYQAEVQQDDYAKLQQQQVARSYINQFDTLRATGDSDVELRSELEQDVTVWGTTKNYIYQQLDNMDRRERTDPTLLTELRGLAVA